MRNGPSCKSAVRARPLWSVEQTGPSDQAGTVPHDGTAPPPAKASASALEPDEEIIVTVEDILHGEAQSVGDAVRRRVSK